MRDAFPQAPAGPALIRVIGIGSPFGDDRAAWRVIELLHGRIPGEVQLLALDRPGVTLINWLPGVRRLVLIDALLASPAGRILCLNPDQLDAVWPVSSHALRLAESLRLAETLGCLPRQVELHGVTIEETRSRSLSAPVATAAAELARSLGRELNCR